jgi:hypothetical protein
MRKFIYVDNNNTNNINTNINNNINNNNNRIKEGVVIILLKSHQTMVFQK